MYLWKIGLLKEDIKENKLTHSDYKAYGVAFLALYGLLLLFAIIQIYTVWNSMMVEVQVFVASGGIYYAYYLNGASQGENFREKLFSIGWVFLLRSVFFMSIGMLNLYVMTNLFGLEALLTAKNSIIIGLLFEILLYWRIAKHIESLKYLSK
jgi:hypothetical protein